ncbi:hypothetical protein SJAG_06002 [Schizosaccharomyces japonicus yFS275]|uniref:Uncharacterized protein n=1 Tax=Schizosaccharomyces japonicus (strain yFS275 / FY16936) TaxID=402676 RepID=T0RSY3_SCHJY|nr:hypothetical protein SJAG_06002 [Schizosaccharomyces japonicus yFS275]EQC53055.1 hypothetical protein SJAG_06002 [Schizosaccharomyces japonicus yFS275]
MKPKFKIPFELLPLAAAISTAVGIAGFTIARKLYRDKTIRVNPAERKQM